MNEDNNIQLLNLEKNDNKNNQNNNPMMFSPDYSDVISGIRSQRSGNLQGNFGYLGINTSNFRPKIIINRPNAIAPTYTIEGGYFSKPINRLLTISDLSMPANEICKDRFSSQQSSFATKHFVKLGLIGDATVQYNATYGANGNINIFWNDLVNLMKEGIYI